MTMSKSKRVLSGNAAGIDTPTPTTHDCIFISLQMQRMSLTFPSLLSILSKCTRLFLLLSSIDLRRCGRPSDWTVDGD
ncbi:hypothetical protein AUR66_08185 [Haloferax profundi]|uniref:Uncharacterized protein n=1 Tax=Haloferax profundi TaxID=1544718 RepID=A0A0W1SVX5_9EURY|nr:hypothetical protein AUR66_08185 [Haloferax profundi]